MGPRETPPSSPAYMEEVVEEIDDDEIESIQDGDVEILDNYEVVESDEDEENQMAEEHEIVEAMEREDACCIFQKHTDSVFCGSLTKDAKYAVTGGQDDKAYVWDAKTGEVVLECTDHKDSVTFADFSYDNTYVATGDMNGNIQVRKTSDKSVIWSNSDIGDATWMQWHPQAYVLIAGTVDGEVYMWKIPDGECKIIQGHGKRAETSCLMPDGKRLVVGYEDGLIRVVDLKTCTVTATLPSSSGHSATITSIDCHLDNNLILSGSDDGKTIVSSANTGKVIFILQDLKNNINEADDEADGSGEAYKGDWVESVVFLKDASQQIAATGTVNGDIYIWDISKKALRHKIDQGSGVTKLIWKENTSLLFSASLDGIIRCYDARSGECKRTLLGHTDGILDMCLSKDGKFLLSTCEDTTARVFEIDEH